MIDLDAIELERKRLAEDLEAKRKVAIERMGAKWIFHPTNMIKRLKNVKPSVLK